MLFLYLSCSIPPSIVNNKRPEPYRYEVICESNEKSLDQCRRKFIKERNIGKFCNSNSVNLFVYVKCGEKKDLDVLELKDPFDVRDVFLYLLTLNLLYLLTLCFFFSQYAHSVILTFLRRLPNVMDVETTLLCRGLGYHFHWSTKVH